MKRNSELVIYPPQKPHRISDSGQSSSPQRHLSRQRDKGHKTKWLISAMLVLSLAYVTSFNYGGCGGGGGSSGSSAPPPTPTGVSASAGVQQVGVSWNSVSGATSYNIYWSTASGVTKATGTKISSVTSPYAHTGRTNGAAYYYVVTAVNSYGESNVSTEVSATPAPSWAKTYGGTGYDYVSSVQQTADDGYILAGYTTSFGAGGYNVWVLKLNSNSTIAWQKTYGGTGWEEVSSIRQTTDGGYIIAGFTTSFGAGSDDVWVLKLTTDGTIAWQKTYGGTDYDRAYSIQQTADGGYIVLGSTNSFGAGSDDAWVLKLYTDGTIAWQKTYGGTSVDSASSIRQTADGGYIILGSTNSFGAGSDDYWVLKLNSNGAIAWQKTYGGTGPEYVSSIQQTTDGGYILAGYTTSFGAGSDDVWVLKLNTDGAIAWQKTYGGTNYDYAYSIQQTTDGGYILVGKTESFGAGGYDVWVLKLYTDGAIDWQKTYGGTDYDWASSIRQTADGDYILAGYTVSFGAGGPDAWVLKLNSNGTCPPLGQNTGVSPSNTSVSPGDTTVSPANTIATVTNTAVTPNDTSATVNQQAP